MCVPNCYQPYSLLCQPDRPGPRHPAKDSQIIAATDAPATTIRAAIAESQSAC